jgi:hypothetical protein
MVEEATCDAHDEGEQRTGWCRMFDEHVELPFRTEVLGVEVTVSRIEERGTAPARCRGAGTRR